VSLRPPTAGTPGAPSLEALFVAVEAAADAATAAAATATANVATLTSSLSALSTTVGGHTTSIAANAAAITAGAVPAGTILPTGRATAATGYLMCDGAAVSRTTYAALFALYGTAFGAGNGTTTFNVPDLLGRAPIGSGTGSGLSAKTLGAKVGTEPSNMPSHSHGIGSSNFDRPAINTAGAEGNIGSGSLVAVLTSTAASGSGSATDGNVPPSQVVNFMVKT
jgi:microcystin-dependent protein